MLYFRGPVKQNYISGFAFVYYDIQAVSTTGHISLSQVLCYCKTTEISDQYDETGSRYYDSQYLDFASIVIIRPDFCR